MVDLEMGRADEHIARLVPLLEHSDGPQGDMSFLLPTLASAYLMRGELDRADEIAAKSVALCRATTMRAWLIQALEVQALVRAFQGRLAECDPLLIEALKLARAIPYAYGEGIVLHTAGMIAAMQGDTPRARENFQAALAIFDRLAEVPCATRTRAALVALGG
jgi:hypothetical protein